MPHSFTLQYWIEDDWYVGRLKDVPGVFSQGRTLADLEANIRDAYRLMTEDETTGKRPQCTIRSYEVNGSTGLVTDRLVP